MTAIAEVMVEMKLVTAPDAVSKLNLADSAAFFDKAIVYWMEQLKPNSTQQQSRWMELSAITLYDLKQRRKKRCREETIEIAVAIQSE